MGKSHVVPLQMQKNPVKNQEVHLDSIPRLELVAAQTSALGRDVLLREAGEDFRHVWMFSDSLTVLNWIRDYDRRFKTFENFRVQRIRTLTKLSEWRHVPTLQNPADICSKGLDADDTKRFSFYHQGPAFLRADEAEWPPAMPLKPETTVQIAAASMSAATTENHVQPHVSPYDLLVLNATVEESVGSDETTTPWPLRVSCRKSAWRSKVRVVALVKKCILKLKERVCLRKNPPPLPQLRPRRETIEQRKLKIVFSLAELEKAEWLLVSAIQNSHFQREIAILMRLNVCSPNAVNELRTKSSFLKALSPFIDENNVLRAGARFGKTDDLPYDSRYPMILPDTKDENVRSLVRHYHMTNMHCSQSQTHFLLRERFFILGG